MIIIKDCFDALKDLESNSIDSLVTALHFSCRSMLIPITRFEDWNADGKIDGEDIQAFIAANKGKGF